MKKGTRIYVEDGDITAQSVYNAINSREALRGLVVFLRKSNEHDSLLFAMDDNLSGEQTIRSDAHLYKNALRLVLRMAREEAGRGDEGKNGVEKLIECVRHEYGVFS